LFVVPVFIMMRRDFPRGFCAALTLFTMMPSTLHLEAGSFELTFQRILLGVVLVCWAPWVIKQPKVAIPFKGLMIAWWISNLISLFVSIDPSLSLKWFLSFSTEMILFYMIVATTITNRELMMRAFHCLCASVAILAILGTIEYYTEVNVMLTLFKIDEIKDDLDVVGCFRHRILFGVCMAMGFPLLLAAAHRAKGRRNQILMTGLVMMAIGACYFSNSRGPWFAAAAAGVIMYVLGTKQVRKSMHIFGVLVVLMLIFRPGVRDTLRDLCMSTFDEDSYRGKSYAYRKELWPVAKILAATSGTRTLFGHGGQTTETMDLYDMFQNGGSTHHTGFSSWDNNYACDLVEFGYVGLGIEVALYVTVLWTLFRATRQVPEEYRDIGAAFTAAAFVYAFSLTNVFMFSPQLKCFFMTVASLGARLPLFIRQESECEVLVPVELEPAEEPLAEVKPT
jgi:hypothetical protein